MSSTATPPLKPWRRSLTETVGLDIDVPLLIGISSPGVYRRRARLAQLMGPGVRFTPVTPFTGGFNAIAGWGLKGKGKLKAERLGVPYLALEDSFLARLGPGEGPYGLLGLSVDTQGVYYDARQATLIEQLIEDSAGHSFNPDAELLLSYLRAAKLSKFNTLDPSVLRQPSLECPHFQAIVVDQIADDLSIAGGFSTAETFEAMLDEAIGSYGAKAVAVKLHPYDGVDGRRGHLRTLAAQRGVTSLPTSSNSLS
ncbi:MAG: hypothetical protein AAF511_06565, partial [Pseudomonadota bacterium]